MDLELMELRTAGMKRQAQELIEQAYNRGYNAGYEDGKKVGNLVDDSYKYIEQGRNEAWEVAKELFTTPSYKLYDIFEEGWFLDIFNKFSASEVIEKLHDYDKEKICVGDEVTFVGDSNTKGIVINAETTHPKIFLGNCITTCHIGDLIPTGRHFPELAEYLKKVRKIK